MQNFKYLDSVFTKNICTDGNNLLRSRVGFFSVFDLFCVVFRSFQIIVDSWSRPGHVLAVFLAKFLWVACRCLLPMVQRIWVKLPSTFFGVGFSVCLIFCFSSPCALWSLGGCVLLPLTFLKKPPVLNSPFFYTAVPKFGNLYSKGNSQWWVLISVLLNSYQKKSFN